MVVAQLVKCSLQTAEIHGSNPVIGRFYFTMIYIEKIKIKKAGNGQFLKQSDSLRHVVLTVLLGENMSRFSL